MAKRPKKQWVYTPPSLREKEVPVPPEVRAEVEARARDVIETVFRPHAIKLHPPGYDLNHIIDISGRWYRSSFFFVSTYACSGPNAISPSFEAKFARLRYLGGDRYALAFMRYTGQWVELYDDVSLDEAFTALRTEGIFQP